MSESEKASSKEPKTLELKYPVNLGSEIVDTLVFEPRVKAKHLRGLQISSEGGIKIDEMTPIIARMTNQPPKLVGELDFDDYQKAMEIVTSFLG